MRTLWRVCLIVVISAWASLAQAEKRVALVFAAERYEHARPLKAPGNDARAVGDALEKLGFEVFHESDRDLKRMRRALDDFRDDAKGADVALVYFAGHGVEIAGRNYLLPVDADPDSAEALAATALPLEEVRAAAASVANTVLIILDACRNDPFRGSGEGRNNSFSGSSKGRGVYVYRGGKVKPGLGRIGRAENTLFAFSAAPGETADDGDNYGGLSPFSAAFARYLGTNGLEIRSVLTLVQQEVYDQSAGKQLPYVENGLPKLFFAAQTGSLPEREALLLAMADVTPAMREEIELIAAKNDMPLAPLYGALISADLKAMTLEDRDKRLMEAAQSFVMTRDTLKNASSSDPQVTLLWAEAERALAIGAFERADSALLAAAKIDAAASSRMASNIISRSLSEADTHRARAGVAVAKLDYPRAIESFEAASALHKDAENGNVPDGERRKRTWLLAALGDLHISVGNTTAALDAYNRMAASARIRISHSANNPDSKRDLSVSLEMIGDVRIMQGDLVGTIEAYRESMAIAEMLVAENPDNAQWQNDLSVSFERMGNVQREQGDLPNALKAYEQSLSIRQSLVALNSDDEKWQYNLSVILVKIGDVRRARGNLGDGLVAYLDSLAIRQKLVSRNSSDTRWQSALAESFLSIGDVKNAQGDRSGAVEAYQADLAIMEKLAEQDPANARWKHHLSFSYERLGNIRRVQSDLTGALIAYERSFSIREALGTRDVSNAELRSDIAFSLENIGKVHLAQGNLAGALGVYERSLFIRKELVSKAPNNAIWRSNLSASFERSGDVHSALGDLTSALKAHQSSLSIRTNLAEQDPANSRWQRDRSVAFVKIGEVHYKLLDLAGAIDAYRQSLEITERLVTQHPENTQWQRDLSTTFVKIGVVHRAQGDLDGALKSYQDSVVIWQKLAVKYPNNTEVQHHLNSNLLRVGDLRREQGNLTGALRVYEDSVAIVEKLAAKAPHDATWQRALILTYWRLADVGAAPRENYQKALDTTLAMQANGTLLPADNAFADKLRNAVANVR